MAADEKKFTTPDNNPESNFTKKSIFLGASFLLIVALVSLTSLSVIKTQIKKDIESNLQSNLKTTHLSINSWAKTNLQHAHHIIHGPEMIGEVNKLLNLKRDKNTLLSSDDSKNFRSLIKQYISDDKHLGFFIVSPKDHINIASMRDSNLGDKNLLSNNTDYLKNIFKGKNQLILPLKTDVAILNKEGKLSAEEPTMFLGVPVENSKGNVIAAFLVRIDPSVHFTRMTEVTRQSSTDKTYLFNEKGLLITESRFDKQLIKAGILKQEQRTILNVAIKKPGGNITEGFKPFNLKNQPLTIMAKEALKGKSGTNLDGYKDYRGVTVVGTWLWDKTFNFGMATELNYEEAFSTYNTIKNVLVFTFSSSATLFIVLILTIINKNNDTIKINKVLSREILERSQAEVMLRNSQDRIRLLLDSTAEAIYGINTNGSCTFANNACAELLGYDSPNEFIGVNMHNLIHYKKPDGTDHPAEECNIYRAYKENKDSYSDKEVLWKKDGTSFPAEYWSHVITIDGVTTGCVVTFFDITEKYEANLLLKESSDKLLQAQELAHLGSWEWNMVTGEIQWSDEIYRIFGRKPQSFDATYEAFLQAIHPDDRQNVVDAVNMATNQGEEYNIEHRILRPDGEVRDIHETGEVFYNEDNRPYRMLGVVKDITTDKKINDELIHAKNLAEKANKAKSEFIASMSHELRTPMNAILGMSSLLEKTKLTVIQKEYIEGLKSSGSTLLEIIKDILDISKIEAGKLTLDNVEFNPAQLIDEICKVLSIEAFSKNIEFFSNIKSSLPYTIMGDPLRLKQILINIIGNAIKFTEKGEISLTVSPEYIKGDELTILFSVKDTGIGIDNDKIETIFEKFSQEDSSTTREFGGTGLGLDISKNLVEKMKGSLKVSSEKGKGSTFSFTAKFKIVDPLTNTMSYTSLNNKRALILTPNSSFNDIIGEYLSAVGMVSHSASSIEQTMNILKNNNDFNVVIMDCPADTHCGFEIMEELKTNSPKIKVLLLVTPEKSKEVLEAAEKIGVKDFITKPLSVNSLYEKILAIVEGKEKTSSKNHIETKNKNLQKKILLVEDDKVSRLFASRVLENNGYTIITATNGREAIESFRKDSPDLILMDVSMPEMDGLDATRLIRKKEETTGSRVPVIALTAFTQAEDKKMCFDSGMDGYLTKPIDQEKLLSILHEHTTIPAARKDKDRELKNIQTGGNKYLLFNKKDTLQKTGGDLALIKEVSEIFINESTDSMESLEKAINEKDFDTMERLSHFIKGRLSFFGHDGAEESASEIENLARNRKIKNTKRIYSELLNTVNSLKDELDLFLRENDK